ncbi:MAG: 50S ribosomal protein L17 [Bacteroidetes bacterium]|nr:50S ribosomal protein L17 [Bacteroidota bacterium]
MRHGDKNKNLGRKKAHRDALLSNLASQLIVHKRITTTLAKAKVLRTYVEPLITKTKKSSSSLDIMHQHRVVFSYLRDKAAVKELFTVVGPKIANRPGGYTRILKLGIRVGDNAEKAMIELVDFNEIYTKGAAKMEEGKKTRRSRSSAKKPAKTQPVPEKEIAERIEEKLETPSDDLKKIEGIGPKAAEALHAAGIDSFEKMATATPESLKEILDAAEGHFNALDTTSWPEQAALAAKGNWEELQTLQDQLNAGRKQA